MTPSAALLPLRARAKVMMTRNCQTGQIFPWMKRHVFFRR